MSARPLSTFQSEGWYRPSGARSEHYFRPSPEEAEQMGAPYAIRSLCSGWGNGGGMRPFLKPLSNSGCATCKRRITAEITKPLDSPWFAEGETTS